METWLCGPKAYEVCRNGVRVVEPPKGAPDGEVLSICTAAAFLTVQRKVSGWPIPRTCTVSSLAVNATISGVPAVM
jgi:hypothetical protein